MSVTEYCGSRAVPPAPRPGRLAQDYVEAGMTRTICGTVRDTWGVTLEFKGADCWIGVYWQVDREHWILGGQPAVNVDLWICLVPMLPLHVQWARKAGRG